MCSQLWDWKILLNPSMDHNYIYTYINYINYMMLYIYYNRMDHIFSKNICFFSHLRWKVRWQKSEVAWNFHQPSPARLTSKRIPKPFTSASLCCENPDGTWMQVNLSLRIVNTIFIDSNLPPRSLILTHTHLVPVSVLMPYIHHGEFLG